MKGIYFCIRISAWRIEAHAQDHQRGIEVYRYRESRSIKNPSIVWSGWDRIFPRHAPAPRQHREPQPEELSAGLVREDMGIGGEWQ